MVSLSISLLQPCLLVNLRPEGKRKQKKNKDTAVARVWAAMGEDLTIHKMGRLGWTERERESISLKITLD